MIMEYHLVFVMMAFILLILTVYLLFLEDSPGSVYAAMFFASVNWLLCTINYYGFLGVDIIGYLSTGDVELNTMAEMYPYFSVFFMLSWVNVVFLYYCWYKHTKKVWGIDKDGSLGEYSLVNKR